MDKEREWIKDQITITLSGTAVVNKYCLTENPEELDIGPDLASALSLARMITDSDAGINLMFTLLCVKARRLTVENNNWLAISYLADKLTEKRTLNYGEAKKVIDNGLFFDRDAGENDHR